MTYKEQLNVLSAVKLPLMLAIVCIHVQTVAQKGSPDWWWIKFWGETVGRIGVPLFFIISGVMYFSNVEKGLSFIYFIRKVWWAKTARRFHSLLIPYIIWNIVAYSFFVLMGDAQFSLAGFINSQWNFRHDNYWFFPANGPLWFVRDLFMTMLFATPLIYLTVLKVRNNYILRRLIFLLLMAFVLLDTQIPLGSLVVAFLLFTIGAFLGINRFEFVHTVHRYRWMFLIVFMIFAVLRIEFYDHDCASIFLNMAIVVGIPAFIGLFHKVSLSIGSVNMASLSMFIFVTHAILRVLAFFISEKLGLTAMPWLDYTARFFLTVVICVFCYIIGRKIFPRALAFSIGGR